MGFFGSRFERATPAEREYLRAMAELNGLPAWGFKVALWAYTGTKDWSELPVGATMSTIESTAPTS